MRPVSSLREGAASPPAAAEVLIGDVRVRRRAGIWQRLVADRSALAGLTIVALLIAVAVLEPLIVPRDPLSIDPSHTLEGPSTSFLFGTDNLGRDIFSRVVAGTRVSVSLALVTVVCTLVIGLVIGGAAGYGARWMDSVGMRVADVFLAFPSLVLALAIAGTLGAGYGSLVIALVATGWPMYSRLVRGGVLAERQREYVDALRGLGARPRRILVSHILPNALSPVFVLVSFDLGTIILFIAALGYLGVGIPPPTPEWGTMISDGRNFVFTAPQMIVFPGLAVALAVVGFNLLGDGLRNALDPRQVRPARSSRRRRRRERRPAEPVAASAAPGRDARASGPSADLLWVDGLQMRIRDRGPDVRAVRGVSLRVHAGETVGLVGESGCGKTMTALSIMRLLPPGGQITGGSIRLGGREITTATERQMRKLRGDDVGMVFQDPMTSLNPSMTIGDQIAGPVRIHRQASKTEARARAAEALALVGMPRPGERLDNYPHQLSGGQRQRVMIAMAIACEPKVLIADEPTTSLDVTIQSQILALLDDLKTRLGMGLLLITHDLGVIAGMADRVMIMYAGQIVESAGTAELFAGMRHPYTQALLRSIPALDQDRGKDLSSIPGQPPDLRTPPVGCPFAPRCSLATVQCHSQDPALVGDEGAHRFACFHPLGDEATVRVRPGMPRGHGGRQGASPRPLVVVEHVVKEFPAEQRLFGRGASVKAVSDVSFELFGGETFGLVGESGCGKTTIGRMLVALDKPDSGSIRFDGVDLSQLPAPALRRRRRDLQLMFQDHSSSLDPRMKIGAILREPLTIHGVGTRAERDARIAELLSEVGLDQQTAGLYPHQFSGGQRQRIGFARALTLNPRLVVADEPVSALDVSIRSQILNLMRRLQDAHQLTYVLISHDLAVVRYLADRIGVMYLGKLVEVGPSDEVYRRPAHPYTAGLLATVPVPDPAVERAKPRSVVRGELPSAVDPPSGCRFRTRCPLAQAVCADEEPPLERTALPAHQVACHFPLSEAASVPMPG